MVADKYRVERLIGSGGMAEVYAAVNVRTERRVALKWILPVLAQSREVMLRFRREALAAGRINHPNVVTIFDVVEHQGSACMVMELLDGEMLSDRLVRTGPLPFVEAVAIMLPAMRGVAAAHAQGVIHRDIKPHNIFLCLDGDGSIREVKVLDFGVSKLTVADAATVGDITLSGNVVGTPEYMAPEQVRAGKEVDHRIDVYSLGVVLYEMLAGRPPYVNQHFSGLMLEIMQQDPPPLSRFRPDVPRRLAGVISRAMRRDPDQRFLDVPSFIQALEMVARDDLRMIVGTPPEGVITRAGFPRPPLTPVSSGSRKLEIPLPSPRVSSRVLAAAVMFAGVAAFALALRWRWKKFHGPETAPPALAESKPGPETAPPPAVAASKPVAPPPSAASTPAAPPPSAAAMPSPPPSAVPSPPAPPAEGPPAAGAVAGSEPASPAASGAELKRSASHRQKEKAKPAETPAAAAAAAGSASRPGTELASPSAVAPPSVPHPRPARAGKLSVDDF
jgi:serine/threonine-protein kinase